jgi:hypothetical protein
LRSQEDEPGEQKPKKKRERRGTKSRAAKNKFSDGELMI